MLTKEHVDRVVQVGHAFVEELGAALMLHINGGGAAQGQPQQAQQFTGPGGGQQAQPQFAQQPQGQVQYQPAQAAQQPPQQQGQAQQGNVTSETIMQLLHTPVAPGKPNLVDDPAARPLLQQALQSLGIGSLPDAKPEQYPALYAAFQQVVAQLAGQGQPQQFAQQPQGGFQHGQQPPGQFQQNPQQQAYNQQFAPQGGYQQQPQGQQFAPQGGGLV